MAVARRVAGQDRAAVVALVRAVYATSVEAWAAAYLVDDSILTGSSTWEQLYALTEGREDLGRLHDYMADKSVNLRRAF